MLVKCVKEYYDLQLKRTINVNEEFEVTEARGKELASTNNKAGYPVCAILESKKSARKKKQEE